MLKAPGAEQVLSLYIIIMVNVNTYVGIKNFKRFFFCKKYKDFTGIKFRMNNWPGDLTWPRDHKVMWHHGWVSLIINPYCAKFCGHRPCRRGDIVQWQTANDCIPYPLFYKKNLRFIFRCVKPYLYQHINISIINNSYLYQHFIDFRINVTEYKHKRM